MIGKYFNGFGALIGIAIPLLVLLIDRLSAHGWWPSWTSIIWPSSYMLIATAGTKDLSALAIMATSIVINGVIYGIVVGVLSYFLFKRLGA
jgi:hypothetical protein